MASDVGTGIAIFIDEMQDLGPEDVSALCAACHELSQLGAPLIVVGAGLPHLPAVLSAAKSLLRTVVPLPAHRPARPDRRRPGALRARRARGGRVRAEGARPALREVRRLSLLRPGVRQGDLGPRAALADHRRRRRVAAPEAEAELAVGFFGSRFERATPAEREYMRAMATMSAVEGEPGAVVRDDMDAAVPTAEIARALGRKPASLSPARDALIKKGLIYSGERGTVAFTVPHFGRYLRTQPA